MPAFSPLQRERLDYKPRLPLTLRHVDKLTFVAGEGGPCAEEIRQLFPRISVNAPIYFSVGAVAEALPLRVAVVFSGGQAAGGHNVVIGVFEALKKLNRDSVLYGFLNEPKGIIDNHYVEITEELLKSYYNQGGFDLLGSGRDKIEKPEQFLAVENTIRSLGLDGLVIIGGDDSNTNAALLAEYLLGRGITTRVVGAPKTIDGDLKNRDVEISFGFDSACKTFSETIGNILRDSLSAKKYYFFIKMMGRSASHIALECALQTHPNMTLISEEVGYEGKTLGQITAEIADMIVERANRGKNYGTILIPEGIIEFIPEFQQLIKELNSELANGPLGKESLVKKLSEGSAQCFSALPQQIQTQLLLDRDPHGNVNVSKIETERLFIDMVADELSHRKTLGVYEGSFNPQPLFLGYEGRACLPTNFDSQYCNALGYTAALLINGGVTGYMSGIKNLAGPVEEWEPVGLPLVPMMGMEERKGKLKPVITKALVDLEGRPFNVFKDLRTEWAYEDRYLYPGPIQFFGPQSLTERITLTLLYDTESQHLQIL